MRYIVVLLFLLRIGLCEATENFGPYKLYWSKCEPCKGPKRGECGNTHLNTNNMSDCIYVTNITQDCPVTKGKITISTLKNDGNTENKLWNYRLDSPCQHFVMGPILVGAFNLDHRCIINKGHYEIHINAIEITRKFLGSNFFYGNFSFKATAFNDKNNLFCTYSVITITKS